MPKLRRYSILVIENDVVWREELKMMYCRVQRHQGAKECVSCTRRPECLYEQPEGSATDQLLECIEHAENADDALEILQLPKRRPIDIVSLDIDLRSQTYKRQSGVTWKDILKFVATQTGMAAVVITGAPFNKDFMDVVPLSDRKTLITL